MGQAFAILVFAISVLGIAVIALKKASVLSRMSVSGISKEEIIYSLKSKIKEKALKDFSLGIFLQKLLSKIRIYILKIENKIGEWLKLLRQNSIEKKNFSKDDYWKKIKK